MKTKTELLRAELKAARDIAAAAEDAGRPLTTAERRRIDGHLAKAAEVKKSASFSSALDDLQAKVDELEGTKTSRPGVFDGVTLRRRGTASRTATRPWSAAVTDLQAKSLVPVGSITVPLIVDDEIAGFGGPRSLIGSVIPFDELDGSDTFSYLRQTVRTNNAAAVAPGALKPTSVVSLEKVDDTVSTIATLSEPIPEQWLRDVDKLEQFLDRELAGMVVEEINDQIINGDGTGANFTGILNTSGVQVQPWSNSLFETIRKAKTKVGVQYDGLVPDALLLNPFDAERLDLLQDNEGRYYLNRGPVGSGPDDPVWRTEVFETTAIAEGVGLIGAFELATEAVIRDEVEVTWSPAPLVDVGGGELHAAFETNQRVYRAEARVGLKVSRPAALVQFPTTASSSSA